MVEEEKTEQTAPEQESTQEYLKPEELFRAIDEIRKTAKPLEPLWGYFLFKKAITSIVGDPGAGKTTLGYSLGKAACLNQVFLEIPFEEPVNALYMDFESADSLVASRANLVIGDEKVSNFYIYNVVEYYLSQVADVLIKFCREKNINLVFIDNQSMAFATRDENDNAEAIKQMRFLRSIVNRCDIALVLFHHTSKANLAGTRKGTGAFARARLADICLNLDVPDESDMSILRLETVKNRLVDDHVLWYIKKEKGGFAFTEPPLGVIGKPNVNTIIHKVQQEILLLLGNSAPPEGEEIFMLTRKDILNKLLKFEERTVDEGLGRLKQLGRIYNPKYSFYAKKLLSAGSR